MALRKQNNMKNSEVIPSSLNNIKESKEDTFLSEIFDKCIQAERLIEEYNVYSLEMSEKVNIKSNDPQILEKVEQSSSNNIKYWERITPVLISSISNKKFAPVSEDELRLSLQLFDFNTSDFSPENDIDMSDYADDVNNMDHGNCNDFYLNKDVQNNSYPMTYGNDSNAKSEQKTYKFFKSKQNYSYKSENHVSAHSKNITRSRSKYSLSSQANLKQKIQKTFKNVINKNISSTSVTSRIVNSYENKVDRSKLNGSTKTLLLEDGRSSDVILHMSKTREEVCYTLEKSHSSNGNTETHRKSEYSLNFTDISYEETNYRYSEKTCKNTNSMKHSAYRCSNYDNSFSEEYDKLHCMKENTDLLCEPLPNVQYGGLDDFAPGMTEKDTCENLKISANKTFSKSKAITKYDLRRKQASLKKKYIYFSRHGNTVLKHDNETVTDNDWANQNFDQSIESYAIEYCKSNESIVQSLIQTDEKYLNTSENHSKCTKNDGFKEDNKSTKYKYFTSKNSSSSKDQTVSVNLQHEGKRVEKRGKCINNSNDQYCFSSKTVSENNISVGRKKITFSNNSNIHQPEKRSYDNYTGVDKLSRNLNLGSDTGTAYTLDQYSTKTIKKSEHKQCKLYSMLTESVCNNIENIINNGCPINVALTIQYKEGFCQLNEPTECYEMNHCTPAGIMLLFKAETQPGCFYYFSFDKLTHEAKYFYRYFFWKIFTKLSCTICFGAKEMVTLFINLFSYPLHEVCFQWKLQDPVVACWILEPDEPLFTFNDIVNKYKVSQVEKRYTNELNQTCYLLEMLFVTSKIVLDEISQKNLTEIFMEMEMKLLPVLAVMESRGVHIKLSELEETNYKIKYAMDNLEKTASKEMGETVNLNSNSCLSEMIKKITSLHGDVCIKTRNDLLSYSVLRSLVPLHPLPAIILAYHHLHKIKQTLQEVNESSYDSESSCAFSEWYQLSTNKGCLPYSGIIPDTIPYIEDMLSSSVDISSICVPRPGYNFLIAAYKHIEFRVLAHLANDMYLSRILQENDDETLLSLAKTGYKEIISDADVEKRLNIILHALIHGLESSQLAKLLNVTERQADDVIHRFLRLFPHVHSYLNSSLENCKRDEKIKTLSGRHRIFNNIKSSNSCLKSFSEKQATDFLIYGSVADIYKAVILRVEQSLAERTDLNAYLIFISQDKLVWEVRESDFKAVKVLVEQAMQENTLMCGVNLLYSIRSAYDIRKT